MHEKPGTFIIFQACFFQNFGYGKNEQFFEYFFLQRNAKNETKVDLVRETFLEDELGNLLRELRA